MKPRIYTWIILLVALTYFLSCEENTYEFGEPFSKIEGINGSFVLTSVTQTDERSTALDNTFDISEFFIGAEPALINFNNSDFTYSLTPGSSPNYLGPESGSWQFDDNEFPTEIQLGSGGSTILALNRTIREIDNTLEFRLTRFCNGTAGVSYNYVFTRQ